MSDEWWCVAIWIPKQEIISLSVFLIQNCLKLINIQQDVDKSEKAIFVCAPNICKLRLHNRIAMFNSIWCQRWVGWTVPHPSSTFICCSLYRDLLFSDRLNAARFAITAVNQNWSQASSTWFQTLNFPARNFLINNDTKAWTECLRWKSEGSLQSGSLIIASEFLLSLLLKLGARIMPQTSRIA